MKIYEADTSHIKSRNRSTLNKEMSTNPSVLFSMIYILQPEAFLLTCLFEDLHWDISVLSLSFEVLYNLKGRFRLQAISLLYHKRKSACSTEYTWAWSKRADNISEATGWCRWRMSYVIINEWTITYSSIRFKYILYITMLLFSVKKRDNKCCEERAILDWRGHPQLNVIIWLIRIYTV